jgi:hypothetical protein
MLAFINQELSANDCMLHDLHLFDLAVQATKREAIRPRATWRPGRRQLQEHPSQLRCGQPFEQEPTLAGGQ